MKKLLLLLFSLLFISCVWIPEEDYSSLRNKTSYKSFSEISDPIILATPVNVDFKYSKNGKQSISKRIGTVYSIYDYKTESVIDSVFTKSQSNTSKLQKLTTSSGESKYLDYSGQSENMYIISPDKTEVQIKNVSEISSFKSAENFKDISQYKLFYYEKESAGTDSSAMWIYALKVFNADTNTFGPEIKIEHSYCWDIKTSDYVPESRGGDGFMWFFTKETKSYPERDTYFLNKLNPVTNTVEKAVAKFDGIMGDKTYAWTDESAWAHSLVYYVLETVGNDLLVKRHHSCILEESFDDYILINKTSFEIKVLPIEQETYIGYANNQLWFIDDTSVIHAYDKDSLDQITMQENEKIRIEGNNYYIKGDVIFAFNNIWDGEVSVLTITAFDCNSHKILSTKEIPVSKLLEIN